MKSGKIKNKHNCALCARKDRKTSFDNAVLRITEEANSINCLYS